MRKASMYSIRMKAGPCMQCGTIQMNRICPDCVAHRIKYSDILRKMRMHLPHEEYIKYFKQRFDEYDTVNLEDNLVAVWRNKKWIG